jgi:hypothetical protein
VGRLQEKYGIASEDSRRQLADFKKVVEQLKKSNARLMTLQARHKSAVPAPRKAKARTSSAKRPPSRVRG